MASLYEIDSRIWDVIQHGYSLDEETGEYWDDEAFEALDMERNAKLEGCALYVKNLEADAAAIKAEEAKLAERRRVMENRAARMREYIVRSMVTFGDCKPIETARVALSLRKSEGLVITDEAAVPVEYLTEKVTVAPNKTAIKAAIKAGQAVPGAALEVRQNLQVK